MTEVVIAVVVIVVLAIAGWAVLTRLKAARKGIDVRAEINAMLPNVGIQWTEIYERLNPRGDPTIKQLLDSFRNSGYQFNPHLGLKVLAAACGDLAEAKAGKGELDRLLGQGKPQDSSVGLEEAVHEAIRQTRALDRA